MKKKAVLAVRVCGWLVIALVTLEICARLEDKVRDGAPFAGNYSMDSLYTYDAIGKYGQPNSSYLKWHLNEVGYRGPALRSGTYRIACIGSSETFGLYESAQKEWPRQLEDILNRRAQSREYEVIDVAYPGLALGTTLKRLPQMLAAVRPQMVVIYPSYTSYIEDGQPQPWPEPAVKPRQPVRASRFELRLAGRFETLMKTAIPDGIQHWMRALQIRQYTRGQQVMARLPEQNVEAFQTDLDRLTTELQGRGIRVLLVTHASRFGKGVRPEDMDYLSDWRKFYPMLTEQGLLDMEQRMSDRVRAVGAARGVPVVDAATLIPGGAENFAEFVHFTDAGAQKLATVVADQIDAEQVGSAPPQRLTAMPR